MTEAPGDTSVSTAEDLRGLLRELRESARRAASAPSDERDAAIAARCPLRERLPHIVWDRKTPTVIGEHLSLVAARVERLRGTTTGLDAATIEILELRGDLSWLPLGFRELPQRETILSLDAELEILGPATEELAETDGGTTAKLLAGIEADLAHIRATRLRRTADRLATEDLPSLDDLRRVYFLADAEGLQDLQDEVQGQIQRALPERAPVEAAAALREFAAENEDVAQETIAAQTELPPLPAADRLDEVRREMQWVRVFLRQTGRRLPRRDKDLLEPRKRVRRWSRRLGRATRRLKRNAQEVRLQARLEGIFGAPFVAFFENLILWLIVAVLGILVAEAMIPAANASATWARVHFWLWVTDAAICAVFLLEFTVRISLVKGRFSWFLRHFLIDLVPSIPYGLIANHFMGLDKLRAGRAIRFARLPRLLRYVRIARPFVRFFRFFGFLQRALDRLVRLHGGLLNRNILLFEPRSDDKATADTADPSEKLRQTRAEARETWRRLSADLPASVRAERLQRFLSGLPRSEHVLALPDEPLVREGGSGALVRAEDIIQGLTDLDAGTVDAELGPPNARRIAKTLERLDVPLLRRLPGIRQMVAASRVGEPLERVVAAGRALGRYCERVLGRIHWVSDLSGVITGPQFLDRLGSAMVQATARPAKRLLFFGFGFLLLQGVVDLLGITFLAGLAAWLEHVLGIPFLILGAACLVVLVFGTWFRRVAGEATDYYSRTAEAQYINLLKSAKLLNLDEDMEILWDRVLRPEAIVHGEDEEGDDGAEALQRRFERGRYAPGTLSREDRVLQLYFDYLDGAVFHLTDTKTTSQLLGNLALEHIRTERLRTSRKERKRLAELDLDRERSSIRGPYLWFRSITYSVAQWTAKLLLEYNRHVIPLAGRQDYPAHVVEEMEAWLDARIHGRSPETKRKEDPAGFVTTEFTALHFLTADEERDKGLAKRFGERTVEALQADRRAMIRTIFGTHPFHRLPRTDRTINPFELYGRYLEGGRVLLFPFYLARLVFRVIRWLLRRVRATLREILNPQRAEQDKTGNWASFDVAVRKINRMRKPVYMECARFRAQFDPEYLGLNLSLEEESGIEGRTYREDLEGIAARDDEWDPFTKIREQRAAALRDLGAIVDAAGGPEPFIRDLRGDRGGGTPTEAFRAVAVAFAIDYRGVDALTTLRERSRELIADVIEKRGRVDGAEWWRRLSWLVVPSRQLKTSLGEFLQRFGPHDLGKPERRWVLRAARADREGLGRIIRLGAALEPGTEPEDAGREILGEVAIHPLPWSEQLVTLRTVQSLSVLDVRNYRRQVRVLGAYGNR